MLLCIAHDPGVEVVGMFFFDDNTCVLRAGDPLGECLAEVAAFSGSLTTSSTVASTKAVPGCQDEVHCRKRMELSGRPRAPRSGRWALAVRMPT
jgi:hypothetical protein